MMTLPELWALRDENTWGQLCCQNYSSAEFQAFFVRCFCVQQGLTHDDFAKLAYLMTLTNLFVDEFGEWSQDSYDEFMSHQPAA